jgi:Pentapeptide repeats (8 copies)
MAIAPKQRPLPWSEYRQEAHHTWELPIFAIKYLAEWVIFYLGRWGLLRVLEYGSFLSVIFAVAVYYHEAPDRKRQKNYQAWQVINTAQGKGGSGGRIEALQELNADHIPLVGVMADHAFLQGIQLPKANLLRSDLTASDLRDCMLEGAHMAVSTLVSTNFRNCDLRHAKLTDANLEDADLFNANLSGADLSLTNLKNADLGSADLQGIAWEGIRSVEGANVHGVKNAPAGFLQWARRNGAISQIDNQ